MASSTRTRHIVNDELRNQGRALNHLPLLKRKLRAIEASSLLLRCGVIEFHPSDLCDLGCCYCTYRRSVHGNEPSKKIFPFSHLEKIVGLSPRAIIFVGGGEPTLYRDQQAQFADIVTYFRRRLPKLRMGLTTNGAMVPEGDWPKHLDWVRVSLDAATEHTFRILKDGSIQTRIESGLAYLKAGVRHVGFGYLLSRFNVHEISSFIRLIHMSVLSGVGPQALRRTNIQFRPTCMIESCRCPSPQYMAAGIYMTPDLHTWWHKALYEVRHDVESMKSDQGFQAFVKRNTNILTLKPTKKNMPIPVFNKCYTSLVRWIIRPTGDVYPCVMKASNEIGCLGNIITQDVADIEQNAVHCYNLTSQICSGTRECCRVVGRTNALFSKALNGVAQYPVVRSPFF